MRDIMHQNWTRILVIINVLIIFNCSEKQVAPLHPDGWTDPKAEINHIAKIKVRGIAPCKVCHGGSNDDYFGGSSGVSCYDCHLGGPSGHPSYSAWTSPDSLEYHGRIFLENDWDYSSCQSCHGEDLLGGVAKVSCQSCHISPLHPDGWINPESLEYHGRVFWENEWDFSPCQSCHGEDLLGGTTETSCQNCHTSGIDDCSNCHGQWNSDKFYPPKDVRNQTDTGLISVGAHRNHMESEIADVSCDQCHIVPETYLDDGHLDSDQEAEINFGLLASDSLSLNPMWDHDTGSCSNVYCHGAFSFAKEDSDNKWIYSDSTITGNDSTFIWTTLVGISCTSCHGQPPSGHNSDNPNCSNCHLSVVGTDNLKIIDKSKHINGKIDVW